MPDEAEMLLNPRNSLEGRGNYKLFYRIERDGTVAERTRLHIVDMRTRETVICCHYLMTLVREVLRDETGVRIVSRDAPWDFRVALSNGTEFAVEITAIADNQHQFIVNGKEDRRDHYARQPQITLRQLKKVADAFPDPNLDKLVVEAERLRVGLDEVVDNPDFIEAPPMGPSRIYLSSGDPASAPLSQRLAACIAAKSAKSADKSDLVLIIDNRTSLPSAEPVLEAAMVISDVIEASPFREIWFYTGYCSDLDGNNSEFSFIPLKVDERLWECLRAS